MGVTEFLPVTVDRTHLIVIGEKLYSRSLELVRELVNNGYDADATEVRADVRPDEIVVADDGSGMDRDGLLPYFQVGVPDKREHPQIPDPRPAPHEAARRETFTRHLARLLTQELALMNEQGTDGRSKGPPHSPQGSWVGFSPTWLMPSRLTGTA